MLETVAILFASLGLAGVIPGPWAIGLSAAALTGGVVSSAGGFARVRSMSFAVATAPLIGKQAVVRTTLEPDGIVSVQGERWRAVITEGTATAGERVLIVDVLGRSLLVEKPRAS